MDRLGSEQLFHDRQALRRADTFGRDPNRLVAGQTQESLEALKGRPVAALSGIGNPAAFERTLVGIGATVVARKVYPDHHGYTPADVEELNRWAGQLPADAWVVTTQKDWVKLRTDRLGPLPLWALRIELESALRDLRLQPPVLPFYSTITGAAFDGILDAAYWSRNLREPV